MLRLPRIAGGIAFLLAIGSSGGSAATAEDLAAIARGAYIFTFPLYESYRVRYLALYSPANPRRAIPNEFRHRRELSGPGDRAVTTPNSDTLFSNSFLDLSHGPLLLEVPEIADRYYSLAFMDFYTNNFAYIGTRATGTRAGRYVIAGPGWTGATPPNTAVIASPTNAVWLLGRFLVSGPQDLPAAHRAQDGLKLSSLGGNNPSASHDRPAVLPNDPWNYFAVVDDALTENPPPARDAPIVARIAAIDIGPGRHFDASRFDAQAQQALLAGIGEAKQQIAAKQTSGKIVNGWSYPPPGIGNFGTDYLLRAAVALKGLAALEPIEAMYLPQVGKPLSGERRYRLHFDAGNLPPANGFWSLSAYEIMPDKRLFFAANPIGRYSIGDKTPGLQRNPDGSLDILIQHDSPGGGLESNWLPVPAGPFSLTLRAYLPQPPLLNASYAPPPLERQP